MTQRQNDNDKPIENQKAGTMRLKLLAIPLCVMMAMSSGIMATPVTTAVAAQSLTNVPVQITEQGKATRLIFSFPTLTAYTAHKAGDGSISFDFRTPATFDAPAGKSESILSFNATRPDAETTTVTIKIADGASYRHYRLQKRVIVEISNPNATEKPAQAKQPATTTSTAKPAKTDTKPADKPAPKMPAVPAPAVEKTPVTNTAAPTEESVADKITAAGTDSVSVTASPMPQDNTPTHITLSTLEPARIAVFPRFNTLWVVLDSSTSGAQLPDVTGPLSALMGKPKITKADNSTAFRFQLPAKNYFSVKKQNIGWDISVTPYPLQGASDQQATLEFEGDKAKLVVPLKGAGRVIELTDPDIGDKIYVVPSNQAETRIDQARSFPNLEILPAAAGMALRPIGDDIKINRIEDFVLVTANKGILATPAVSAGPAMMLDTTPDTSDSRRLFDFPNWRQGGLPRLNQNVAMLEKQIAAADDPDTRTEMIMKLALLYFANNMGQESLGALRLIEMDYPETAKNPNFIALRGAANAMAGHYDEALQDLSNAALQQHPEVKLWVGYVAAATEQWHMANQSFPKDNQLLAQYPENISVPFTIYMAESALRLGRAQSAEDLLDTLNMVQTARDPHYNAAIAYLRGEIARQEGRIDDAGRIWKDVASGLDRLYHTKASLALANMEYQEKKIPAGEAVDRIDSLRFAWRGDGLEVQILHNLGLLKIKASKFLEGLQDMRTATKLAESQNSDDEPIKNDMIQSFASIFDSDGASITPIEAVSVYNEFGPSLIPPAEAGANMQLHAADFMISIDLLEKAETIIEKTLADGYVAPDKIAATGAKLAAVYLVDGRPSQAIAALDKTGSSAMDETQKESRALLRARALSQMNRVDEATNVLKPYTSADAQKLKVDMLWKAQKWAEAAEALDSILPDAKAESLTPTDADIIINTAVACKLANDSSCLQNLKTRYTKLMAATKQATTFSVVTRDGGMSSLSDRETILRIAGETDMFKQFLDSYKTSDVTDDDPATPTGSAPDANATTAQQPAPAAETE